MIVQCKQCRTKFRFDDAEIDGDGIWVRCSRCQHVFFQDNPKKLNATAAMPPINQVSSQKVTPEKTTGRLAFEPANDAASRNAPDEDVASFLSAVMEPAKTASGDLMKESQTARKAGRNLTDIEFSPGFEDLDEMQESEDESEEEPASPVRKKNRAWKIALWTILVIVIIPAIIYFVVFPQLGERYFKLGERGVDVVLNVIGLAPRTTGQSVIGSVKIQNVRQRIINNYILGNIRIVEGTAVNRADFPIARILVKGEILDPYAVVMVERLSYAGNVLTDEELTNLSEEEIIRKLSLPSGLNNSNERVIPNGQIPFMIVFTRESPGTIKTTVMIAGAERLL